MLPTFLTDNDADTMLLTETCYARQETKLSVLTSRHQDIRSTPFLAYPGVQGVGVGA